MPEVVLTCVIAGVIAIYGVFKYQKSETTDYNAFVTRAGILETQLNNLEAEMRRQVDANNTKGLDLQSLELKLKQLEGAQSAARSEQIEIKERLAKKRPVIQLRNPIPVEVVTRDLRESYVHQNRKPTTSPPLKQNKN